MANERVVLCFFPADDVTDLDEWFARLDSAVSLGTHGGWDADSRHVRVEVDVEDVDELMASVRESLGDAVIVVHGNEPLVLDAEGGESIAG